MLTGNGVAFVLRVPGTVHGDWWSLRGWWIFVGHRRGRAPLEARDPLARRAHLQPVQHRARPLLPPARPDSRRAARLLVGPDVGLARARARCHRRGRLPHPPAAEAAAGGDRLLDLVRGGDRRARARRAHDDRALAPRPDLGLPPVVGARHLARGARVPLLHDHRPEDGTALPDAAGSSTRSRSACSRG